MRVTMRATGVGLALLATAGVAAAHRVRSGGGEAPGTSENVAAATRRGIEPRTPAERAIAAPSVEGPAVGEVVRGAPTLSWRLAAGTDGARVELSPTSDFDDAATLRYDAPGDRLVVPAVPGVWHWRLRGRSAGAIGEAASPVASFTVVGAQPQRPEDLDWGNPYDLLLHGIRLGPTRDMR
jgi:hypothetical protein